MAKRLWIIVGAVVVSVSGAFLMRSLDAPADPWDDLVLPSGERIGGRSGCSRASEQMRGGDFQEPLERVSVSRSDQRDTPEQLSSYFGFWA